MIICEPIYILPDNTIISGVNAYQRHLTAWSEYARQRESASRTATPPTWPWQVIQAPTRTSGGTGTI